MTAQIADPYELVRKLFPFGYSVVSEGNDAAVAEFARQLPFQIHEFSSGLECNGWVVPQAVVPKVAKLYSGDTLVYDAMTSPLGVPALCPSVDVTLSLEELLPHLFFSDELPDAIPYHWTNHYRPGEKAWGLCIPKRVVNNLRPGTYRVHIDTDSRPGTMKVLDFTLPGESRRTILLNAHNCHPFQANDDISGCAVAIAAMQHLLSRSRRRFTYRLVIAPELIGTVHWLDRLADESRLICAAILLKSVGNFAPLKLQRSYTGQADIDRAAHHAMHAHFGPYLSGPFRTVYGNDETVFEAPGYEIPTVSFTRFPFAAYHTDADRPELISSGALDETLQVLLSTIESMECDRRYVGKAKGLVCLSHPRHNLYRPAPAVGIDRGVYTQEKSKWNLLMNCLPRHLDGKTGMLELADRYDLPVKEVQDYVEQWVAKGLAEMVEEV